MHSQSASDSWLNERYRQSLDLAEDVFDSLRQAGTGSRHCQPAPGDKCYCQSQDGCGESILASELARVLGALRDCADGTGGFVPIESTPSHTPLARSGVDRNIWSQEVSREEFLKALREAFGIVGRRAFDSVLRAQLRLLAQERQSQDDAHSERSPCTGRSSSDMDTTRASGVPASTTSGSESGKTQGSSRRQPPQLSYGGDWAAPATAPEEPGALRSKSSGGTSSPATKTLPMITPTPSSSLASALEAEARVGSGSPEPWESFPNCTPANSKVRQVVRRKARGKLAQMSAATLNYDGFHSGSAPSSPLARQTSEPSQSPHRQRSSSVAGMHAVGLPIRGVPGQSPTSSTPQNLADSISQPALSRQVSPGGAQASSPLMAQLGFVRKSLEDIATEMPEQRDSLRSSPAPSVTSIERWHFPQETLIFFDWDDTLCPTTWIHEDQRLAWCQVAPCFADPSVPMIDPALSRTSGGDSPGLGTGEVHVDALSATMLDCLQRHVDVVCSTLRTASNFGHVAIVTLAKQGWVELSMQNFMPGLIKVMEELGVDIIYAREALSRWKLRSAVLDELNVFQLMKQEAFRHSIKRFYSSGKGRRCKRSWKNVLCVGDSETERDAVTEVVFRHSQLDKNGSEIPCRCKTVKLPEDPDLQQLTTELQLLSNWLEALAQFDGDIGLDLSNPEETMIKVEKVLHAADRELADFGETLSPRQNFISIQDHDVAKVPSPSRYGKGLDAGLQ
mmetsp:Transcript_79726/g.151398  ORF Transcript_79726/g.151398 Transcript_79726/m.151398 type:complete len:735 (-) Transcript_79726:23-2227(-)